MQNGKVIKTYSVERHAYECEDILNHHLAIMAYAAGNIDLALEILQYCSAIDNYVTKEQWLEHAEICVNANEIISSINYD